MLRQGGKHKHQPAKITVVSSAGCSTAPAGVVTPDRNKHSIAHPFLSSPQPGKQKHPWAGFQGHCETLPLPTQPHLWSASLPGAPDAWGCDLPSIMSGQLAKPWQEPSGQGEEEDGFIKLPWWVGDHSRVKARPSSPGNHPGRSFDVASELVSSSGRGSSAAGLFLSPGSALPNPPAPSCPGAEEGGGG